jgi:hypothetical protein
LVVDVLVHWPKQLFCVHVAWAHIVVEIAGLHAPLPLQSPALQVAASTGQSLWGSLFNGTLKQVPRCPETLHAWHVLQEDASQQILSVQ